MSIGVIVDYTRSVLSFELTALNQQLGHLHHVVLQCITTAKSLGVVPTDERLAIGDWRSRLW